MLRLEVVCLNVMESYWRVVLRWSAIIADVLNISRYVAV